MDKNTHMCLKAPTDFLAWRQMKNGDVCPYCGYVHVIEEEGKEESK